MRKEIVKTVGRLADAPSSSSSFVLGAAFLTSTVETTRMKQKGKASTVQNSHKIETFLEHEDEDDPAITTPQQPLTRSRPAPSIPRPSIE
jgi:hypothetical protein